MGSSASVCTEVFHSRRCNLTSAGLEPWLGLELFVVYVQFHSQCVSTSKTAFASDEAVDVD